MIYIFIYKFEGYGPNQKGENTTFLSLNLPEGDYCEDGDYMSLTYIFQCDESQEDLVITNQNDFDDESCANTIKMKTKYGMY